MKAVVGAMVLVCIGTASAAAQVPEIRISAAYALEGYREQSNTLDFRGGGPAVRLDAVWRQFGLVVQASRVPLDPTDMDANPEGFTATETDVAVRYRPSPTLPVAVEAGVVRRSVSPGDAAQAMRAWRLGVVATFALADGAELGARAGWLVGAKFSGGGTAATGLTVGLRTAVRPLRRFPGAWLVADYEFQRVDRVTDLPVPIEASMVRLGFEGRFIP